MKKILQGLIIVVFLTSVVGQSAWEAPAKAAAKQNPLANRPQLAAGGAKVFSRSCASCHEDAARREKSKAPDLASQKVQSDSDGALFWKISSGNSATGMPSFSSLPEGQRWQLVLYVRSLASRSK
jgi:mono/diheme cytochrome c family protein